MHVTGRLPGWARRTNPLVRRHLGGHLPSPVEIRPLLRWLVVQVGLIVIWGLSAPSLHAVALGLGQITLALPVALPLYLTLIAAVLVYPFSLVFYAHVLFSVGRAAFAAIYDELRQDTLSLLRVTPFSLNEIFLGKIAAGIWQQMDNLESLLRPATILLFPPLLISTGLAWPMLDEPLSGVILMLVGMAVSVARIGLELLMIGALGIAVGTLAGFRFAGVFITGLLGATYFVLLNLLRLLPLGAPLRLLVEYGLPVLLPLVIIRIALSVAARQVDRTWPSGAR
jgi:hypothetical protein